jgi:Secretion system C-terminal sorting domain
MKTIIGLLFLLSISSAKAQNTISIPFGDSVSIDGTMISDEWSDSDSLDITFLTTKSVRVYYKHDGQNFLACYKGNLESANVRFPEILFDIAFDRSSIFQSDDWWFHVSTTDCEYKGRYGHYINCELERPNWTARNNIIMGNPITDLVEISIPFTTLNININTVDTIGISFLITNTANAFHHWPNGAHRLYPITWGKAVFDKVGLAVDYTKGNEQFYLWPNPSNDRVFIKSNKNEEMIYYSLIDVMGKEIVRNKYSENGIDISTVPAGIYFINVNQGYYRLVKE